MRGRCPTLPALRRQFAFAYRASASNAAWPSLRRRLHSSWPAPNVACSQAHPYGMPTATGHLFASEALEFTLIFVRHEVGSASGRDSCSAPILESSVDRMLRCGCMDTALPSSPHLMRRINHRLRHDFGNVARWGFVDDERRRTGLIGVLIQSFRNVTPASGGHSCRPEIEYDRVRKVVFPQYVETSQKSVNFRAGDFAPKRSHIEVARI